MSAESEKLSRRQALRITAVAAGAIGAGAATARWLASGKAPLVEASAVLMGSPAQVRLVTDNTGAGEAAIEDTFDRMRQLESQLSRFQPESDLSRLNRDGALGMAAPALLEVVERALTYRDLTGGAFDITVEPLLAAQREAAEIGTTVAAAEAETLLQLVGADAIQLDSSGLRFSRPGMAITLDGIAKGFIIDRGADRLRNHGFNQILVEVGGDLFGGPRQDSPWRIGVRAPRGETAIVGVTELVDQAMATSGDYLNAFLADFSLHHILDPRSGLSPALLASASVVAPTAMDADALSTSLLVLGPVAGMALIERLPQVEAMTIGKDGQITMSSGFLLNPA